MTKMFRCGSGFVNFGSRVGSGRFSQSILDTQLYLHMSMKFLSAPEEIEKILISDLDPNPDWDPNSDKKFKNGSGSGY